jgi:hypothetical protein
MLTPPPRPRWLEIAVIYMTISGLSQQSLKGELQPWIEKGEREREVKRERGIIDRGRELESGMERTLHNLYTKTVVVVVVVVVIGGREKLARGGGFVSSEGLSLSRPSYFRAQPLRQYVWVS